MSNNISKSEEESCTSADNLQRNILEEKRSETRSILKHKDYNSEDDTQSRRDSVKKLQFDESAIEIKTSYTDPVDAEILRTKLERLQKLQLRSKLTTAELTKQSADLAEVSRMNDQVTETMSNMQLEHCEPNTTPQETFEMRRKEFYRNEYKRVQSLTLPDIPSSSSNLSTDIACSKKNEQTNK